MPRSDQVSVDISSDWREINILSSDLEMITGGQLRAARALLGISAEALAKLATLGVATVRRAEQQNGPVSMTASNCRRLIETLHNEGVEIIPENGGGEGVRRRKNFAT